ncbi:unnamed protein product [Tilletia controversa]|nr:unnamed protein product [Tilletia controversa]CAD6963658.1 unnamed protein product [Tilletia controversa]CAD6966897.1 unnamed protein product [Tilletia controversa]
MPVTDFNVLLSLPDGSSIRQDEHSPDTIPTSSLTQLPPEFSKLAPSKVRVSSVSLPFASVPTLSYRRNLSPVETVFCSDKKQARNSSADRTSAPPYFVEVYINGQRAFLRRQAWKREDGRPISTWLAKAVPLQLVPGLPRFKGFKAASRATTSSMKGAKHSKDAKRAVPKCAKGQTRIVATDGADIALMAADGPLDPDSSASVREPIRSFTLVLFGSRWPGFTAMKRLEAVYHFAVEENAAQQPDSQEKSNKTTAKNLAVEENAAQQPDSQENSNKTTAKTMTVVTRLPGRKTQRLSYISTDQLVASSAVPGLGSTGLRFIFRNRRTEKKKNGSDSDLKPYRLRREALITVSVEVSRTSSKDAPTSDDAPSSDDTSTIDHAPTTPSLPTQVDDELEELESYTPDSGVSYYSTSQFSSPPNSPSGRSTEIRRKPVPRTPSIQDLANEEDRRQCLRVGQCIMDATWAQGVSRVMEVDKMLIHAARVAGQTR